VSVDRYAGAQDRWAAGASLVYGPIADALVDLCPHDLAGRVVLDIGAGTGVAGVALAGRGAHQLAVDLSYDMLAWNRAARPPAAVADVRFLPLAGGAVDDCVAAFVLNHLVDPAAGFAELIRVTRPGGAVLACVYSNASRSEDRDRVDAVARAEGWVVPDWYLELKAGATPVLGSAERVDGAARDAGLVDAVVDERSIDVGVTTPEQLVEYRFGQAHYSAWLDQIGEARAAIVRSKAADAIRPMASPYRPIDVFLATRTPSVASNSRRPSGVPSPGASDTSA